MAIQWIKDVYKLKLKNMYKVEYTKVALTNDGHTGDISQGDDIAYIACSISDIESNLRKYCGKKKIYPTILKITRISGNIVY